MIRSRTRLNLNLPVAAAHFCIHRRQDHANFADQVRIHLRRRLETVRPPFVVHADAVALDIDVAGTDAGQLGLLGAEDFVIRQKGPTHDADKIQHVVAHERQILNLFFRQHRTDRGRRSRDQSIGRHRHFNRLRCGRHFELHIETKLSCIAELDIIECLRAEPRQRRADLISSRLKAGKVVSPCIVAQHRCDDARRAVGRRNADPWYQGAGCVRYRSADSPIAGLTEESSRREKYNRQ